MKRRYRWPWYVSLGDYTYVTVVKGIIPRFIGCWDTSNGHVGGGIATRIKIRLLIVTGVILALLTDFCPTVMGAVDGSWRGYRIVTVISSGSKVESDLDRDIAPPVDEKQPVEDVIAPAAGDGVIRVGVIDSGISSKAGLNVVDGRNYLTDESFSVDHTGHGTALASIIAAATPDAELISLKISATGAITTAEVAAAAIIGAVDEFQCDILLLAFGQSDTLVLRQAVEYAASRGVVLIAAVGNEGQTYKRNKLYYPAGYDQVIGIGATDVHGEVAPFSQRAGVSFVSCGERLQALNVDGQAVTVTGTSFSAAAVAGLAAQLKMEAAEPFRAYLHSVAEDKGPIGYDNGYGFGSIDPTIGGEHACLEE